MSPWAAAVSGQPASTSNTDLGAQGDLVLCWRKCLPALGAQSPLPLQVGRECHGLDQPVGPWSHLGPCLASHQDKNLTLSMSEWYECGNANAKV